MNLRRRVACVGFAPVTDRGAPRLVHAAALVALVCAAGACSSQGSPASPSFQGAPVVDASVVSTDGGDAGYFVCPPGLDASFSDLLYRVMSTQESCGTSMVYNCHSPTGATPTGSDNLLNFALVDSGVEGGLDAATIYAELVNHTSRNSQCTDPPSVCQSILRVAPGDAGASLLYIKLTLKAASLHYGGGMPVTAPGSICPEALDAFKSWIDQGAKMN
jgi:hypothetical protein